jgi:hypothetical protein
MFDQVDRLRVLIFYAMFLEFLPEITLATVLTLLALVLL